MNLFNRTTGVITLILVLYGGQATAAAPYISNVQYNSDIDYLSTVLVISNLVIFDNTVTPPGSSATPLLIREIRGAVIDGFHIDDAGRRYFSFDADTLVNGSAVLKGDILRCNISSCSSFSLVFNAVTENFKHININAFTFDPANGDLIFSVDSDTFIGGAIYLAADIIRYDGTNYSLFYDSQSSVITEAKNIDALSFTDNNKILISLVDDSVLNTIYAYDTLTFTWSIAYNPTTFGDDYNQVNISSLMVQTQAVPDLMFSDGFED